MPKFKCDICGKEVEGYWNNPAPLEGKQCCDNCNKQYVIPARMKQINVNKQINDDAAGKMASIISSVTKSIGNAMEDEDTVKEVQETTAVTDADYSKVTKQGFKITAMFREGGRLHVIAKRASDFVIGLGYNTVDGSWSQGRYDYSSYEDALHDLMEEKPYSKKIQDSCAKVKETQVEDAAPVFKITYKRDGIYSAVMMRGSNENEVRNKFKNLTGYEIAGVVPCKESDIAEFSRRGMAVVDCAISDCGMGKAYVEEYDCGDNVDKINDEDNVEIGELSVGNKYRWEERYEGLILTIKEVNDNLIKLTIDNANKAVVAPVEKFNELVKNGNICKVDNSTLEDSKITDSVDLKKLASLINQAVEKAEKAGTVSKSGIYAEDDDDCIKVGVSNSNDVRPVENIVKSIINANSEAKKRLEVSTSSYEVFIDLK